MEDGGEIEYLDEDEDLIQQYVQGAPPPTFQTPIIQSVTTLAGVDIEEQITPLLVERKRPRKAKTEDDSDYDPNEDLQNLIAERNKTIKRRKITRKVQPKEYTLINKPNTPQVTQNSQNLNKNYEIKLKNLPNLTVQKKPVSKKIEPVKKPVKKIENLNERKDMDIRIPDYEDPICLPVRAIKRDEYDIKKLRLWNNLCLEHYGRAGSLFKTDKGETLSSTRTVILRNLKNKYTGKIDTTVHGKTTVTNTLGQKKTETYQGTLPKYREKKLLNSYPLEVGNHRFVKHTYEVLLTKEEQKNEETLVVYKPREAVSAVYKCIENKSLEDNENGSQSERRVAKEVTCCKVCAPCYQASWRGVRKQNNKECLVCAVCSRTFVSVYNLLSHLNSNHTAKDVAAHSTALSKTLAAVVEYHYRCRICQQQFQSIKLLRKHVTKHQGVEVFKCEIGNHMAS